MTDTTEQTQSQAALRAVVSLASATPAAAR